MKKMSRRKKKKLITLISSSVFVVFLIIFLLIILLQPSCKKDVDRTNGIYADNFSLNVETKSVEFDYVFILDRAAIQREINKITKLGVCFHLTSGEAYREFTFDYEENKAQYRLSVEDVFEEDYGNIIKLDLYYIYDDDGKEKRRFSEEQFDLSVYELAKNIEDDYAYNIISKAENSIVRIDVEYDIESETISYDELKGYTAEVVIKNNSNLQVVLKVVGDNKFSEYARIYFNGRVTSDYVLENNVITYTTKISYVTNVDIDLNEETYSLNNADHELYKVYFGNLFGQDKYRIIIELKDNNLLSKGAEFRINGNIIEAEILKPGYYYIDVANNGIKNINISLNKENFEYTKDSDLYNISIGRDERHEDIAVTISPVEGTVLSKFANVLINGEIYNLSTGKYEYQDGNIICYVEDERISRVDITLNTSRYIVSCDSECYKVEMRNPNYLEIIIDIQLKYGYEYSHDVALFVNGIRAEIETYIIDENIMTYTIEDPNWSAPF